MEIRFIEPGQYATEIIDLFRISLGEEGGIPEEEFWAWKHYENPFGQSPTVGAWADGKLVGLRTFLVWRFRSGAETVLAYRAVDTATHPDYRGRKLFTRLTTHLLEQLQAGERAFVFNTPNKMSRPGYLKMGWRDVGKTRLVVGFLPANMVRNRIQQKTWPSLSAAWSDSVSRQWQLLAPVVQRQFEGVLTTDYSEAYFRWRYFRQPRLNYHYWVGPGVLIFFRLKAGRQLRELRITEIFFQDRHAFRQGLRELANRFAPDVITYLRDSQGVIPIPFGFFSVNAGLNITFRVLNDPTLETHIVQRQRIFFSSGTLELF
jgi:GNAT superfamily N-acetyltransferase